MPRTSSVLAVLAFALVACSSNGDSPGTEPGVDAGGAPGTRTPLPCDVDRVLAGNCRTCHGASPAFGAPMPLVTLEDLHAPSHSDPSKPVYAQVGARIHDDARPMPQPPNARLDANATATLDAWVAAGAPAGDACTGTDAGAGGVDAGPTLPEGECVRDVAIRPAAAWTMPATTDDVYVCYGFDAAPAAKRHAVEITPVVGNSTIVHHVLLYQSSSSFGATPAPCDPGGSLQWRVVYAWAPGGKALTLPPEAGFAVEPGTHYVVQVHYSNLNHLAGQTDQSGFDLCTTNRLRPNDADVLAFGTQSFTIPPHGQLDVTCNVQVPKTLDGLHLFSAFPHMHKLGKSIATVQRPGGSGAPVDLGAQASWSFDNQPWSTIAATLHSGDVVATRCAWANPGESSVSFGTATSDEMCYSFTAYWPKVTGASWSWALPALQSSCSPTAAP